MDYDVARIGRVWENRVRLDDLLGEAIIQPFQEKRAQT
jgi:hypothetical protein